MSFWTKLLGSATDVIPTPEPSAAATSSNSTSWTLQICASQRIIPNPTDADIREAVMALDDSEMATRLVLSTNGGANKIQLSGTPGDFGFDYHEHGAQAKGHFYASKRTDYSAETALKVLLAYRNGAADWGSMVEWKKLRV